MVCIVAIFVLSMVLSAAAYADRGLLTKHPANSSSIDAFQAFVTEASRRFGVPEIWIRAVMRGESGGKLQARSPKGAMGLMQIMPKTWDELRARYNLGADAYHPRNNILAGAGYIRELSDRYGSPGFLAAYNAGPRRYERHLATGSPLPRETQAYVATLMPMIASQPPLGRGTVAAMKSLPSIRSPLFVPRASNHSAVDRSSHDLYPVRP
jgi:soluble lytic murein transglycosylase-like protein